MQVLALVSFVSVFLMRENLRGLRDNLKHKIRTYVIHKISQGHVTFFEEVGIDSRKHAQDSLKTQKTKNK